MSLVPVPTPEILWRKPPVLALGVQSLVTLHFVGFGLVDLPLMVVIYFAMERQRPVSATLGGALMGVLQDGLTHQPIGVFGIAKAFVGYLAASLGVRIDTDAHGTRLVLTFLFVLLHNGIDWVLMTDPAAKSIVYQTFGRSPATEVIIDHVHGVSGDLSQDPMFLEERRYEHLGEELPLHFMEELPAHAHGEFLGWLSTASSQGASRSSVHGYATSPRTSC